MTKCAKPDKPKALSGQYGIIVICDDERHQEELYERLQKILEGVKLKVVCV